MAGAVVECLVLECAWTFNATGPAGSRIAYPDGETWTRGNGYWHHDGTDSHRRPEWMHPGWVEVQTVPVDALDKLRERASHGWASVTPRDDFFRAVDGERLSGAPAQQGDVER